MSQTPKPPITVKHLRETGHGMVHVKGGPFKASQTLEWQILNSDGAPCGALTGDKVALALNHLVELRQLLLDSGALSHIQARINMGYMQIPVEMQRRLERLLSADL